MGAADMAERTVTFDDEEWQLVPRKPTPEMLGYALSRTAVWLELSGSRMTVNYKKMSIRYRAMLKAAPCPYPLERTWDQEFECALVQRSTIYRDRSERLGPSSLAAGRGNNGVNLTATELVPDVPQAAEAGCEPPEGTRK